jgi:alanyl-tRNA synthetase
MPMTSTEIRNKFIAFFKNRDHTVLASAPLVPENDPTVLFNTAGMQPLVPYLMGREHPSGSRRLVDIQKCVRTGDIDDIGDNTHATFFEMMGNWSLGDYFKFEAINWSYEFLTSKEEGLGLDPQRLYITVFEGDENAPKDEETASIWREIFEKNKVTGERIYFLGKDANWWPAVKKDTDAWSGPTGPCTEMFYDLTGELNSGMTKEEYLKADEQQKVVEIWNNVFMEYVKENGKIISKLEKKNVDTGSGFERMVAVVQGKESIFDTDVFCRIDAGDKRKI